MGRVMGHRVSHRRTLSRWMCTTGPKLIHSSSTSSWMSASQFCSMGVNGSHGQRQITPETPKKTPPKRDLTHSPHLRTTHKPSAHARTLPKIPPKQHQNKPPSPPRTHTHLVCLGLGVEHVVEHELHCRRERRSRHPRLQPQYGQEKWAGAVGGDGERREVSGRW